MIYYAVAYMNDGQIHLKPFGSIKEAEENLAKLKSHEKWGSQVKLTKVVKKDPDCAWFKSVNGYWI